MSTDWIRPGGLCIPPGLSLSFQRFAWPETGLVERAPPSLGALPVGLSAARELILPLAQDECFWLGLSLTSAAQPIALAVGVELRTGKVIDAISGANWRADRSSTVTVPDTSRIEGIRRLDGRLHVFARDTGHSTDLLCARLMLRVAAASAAGHDRSVADLNSKPLDVTVRLVDYATFAMNSGMPLPGPLNTDAGYKGWRLP